MANLDRRTFLALTASGAAARALAPMTMKTTGKRVLTLVYDKSLGMMRAVDRVVN